MPRHPDLNRIRFSKWMSLDEISIDPAYFKVPGVYLLANCSARPRGAVSQSDSRIIYIGMSNKSVLSRLRLYPRTLSKKRCPEKGRMRKFYQKKYRQKNLYISVYLSEMDFPHKDVDLSSNQIRELGKIQYLEKNAMAKYKKCNNRMPYLNTNIRG